MTARATTKKATAAKKAEPAKPQTRKELLAGLAERNYTGPVSFTVATLRDVVAWLDAGAHPGDESIPNGVRYAVHPDLKPTSSRTCKAYNAGRLDALKEVGSLMQGKNPGVGRLRTWLREQVEAIAEQDNA